MRRPVMNSRETRGHKAPAVLVAHLCCRAPGSHVQHLGSCGHVCVSLLKNRKNPDRDAKLSNGDPGP